MAGTSYAVKPDCETSGVEKPSPIFPEIASVIGIDIGTSRCSMAVWNGYEVELLKNIEDTIDETRIRSYVTFEDDIYFVNGIIPGSTIFNMKHLIGRMDTDPVVHASKNVPFLVQTLDIGLRPFIAALVKKKWRSFTPEEVLALYLSKLRTMLEEQLKRPIRKAVVTFPVSFNRFQLHRLESACTMAGLRVVKRIPEPTAVAMLYGQQQQQQQEEPQTSDESMDSGDEKIALIFNMGAGYTDVAVVNTHGGETQIEALAGSAIGGEDLLQNMMRFLLPEFESFSELGEKDIEAIHRLRFATEFAIHGLSSVTCFPFNEDLKNGIVISRDVYRDDFERVNSEVFKECERLIIQCLQDATVEVEEVDDVIVVGGCSCIPKVKNLVSSIFKGKQLYEGMDPLEAAVRGAALEAAVVSAGINDHNPLGLSTIQITPHAIGIGIQAEGNNFVPVIPRNTIMPARMGQVFTTINDNQTEALIIVYEGDGNKVEENKLLGYFKVRGIPAAPKGIAKIVVLVEIKAEKALTVYAAVKQLDSVEDATSAMEVKMPTVDDGHCLCAEAVRRAYGSRLGLASLTVQNRT